jgi:hypothetical protein
VYGVVLRCTLGNLKGDPPKQNPPLTLTRTVKTMLFDYAYWLSRLVELLFFVVLPVGGALVLLRMCVYLGLITLKRLTDVLYVP